MSRMRALTVILLLASSAAITRAAVGVPPTAPHLASLPYAFEEWQGADGPPIDDETLKILAADDLLNRTYAGADGTPIGLYVAYYARQRPGVSIHSPLHCLPGTGWEALDVSTLSLPASGDANGTMRRLIVRKGLQRALGTVLVLASRPGNRERGHDEGDTTRRQRPAASQRRSDGSHRRADRSVDRRR